MQDDKEKYTEEGFDVVGETLKQEAKSKKERGRMLSLFNYSAIAALFFMAFFIFITYKSRQNVGQALEMEKEITKKLEEQIKSLEAQLEEQRIMLEILVDSEEEE